mgnify:CR=1 FL=1
MEATTRNKPAPAASSPKRRRLPGDPATRYAKAVVSGKTIAGPHVRAACARHIKDLEDGAERGLIWDQEAVAHALAFFAEVLCLNGGEYEGRPFEPLAWQRFVIGSIFGVLGGVLIGLIGGVALFFVSLVFGSGKKSRRR